MSARAKAEAQEIASSGRDGLSRRAALARLKVALWPLLRHSHVYVQVFAAQLRDGLDARHFPDPALDLDYGELLGLLEEVGGHEAERTSLQAAWGAVLTLDREGSLRVRVSSGSSRA